MAEFAMTYTAERNIPKVSDAVKRKIKHDMNVDNLITVWRQ